MKVAAAVGMLEGGEELPEEVARGGLAEVPARLLAEEVMQIWPLDARHHDHDAIDQLDQIQKLHNVGVAAKLPQHVDLPPGA